MVFFVVIVCWCIICNNLTIVNILYLSLSILQLLIVLHCILQFVTITLVCHCTPNNVHWLIIVILVSFEDGLFISTVFLWDNYFIINIYASWLLNTYIKSVGLLLIRNFTVGGSVYQHHFWKSILGLHMCVPIVICIFK